MSILASAPAAAAPGDLDPTFSRDGIASLDLRGFDTTESVAIQPDGRIVSVGGTGVPWRFLVTRFTASGRPDRTFSGDGSADSPFATGSLEAHDVALQADGRILAVGSRSSRLAVARYMPDGSLDPSFGDGGLVTTDIEGGDDEGAAIAIGPDGRIVVAGQTDRDLVIVGYTPSGELDSSFADGGVFRADFGESDEASDIVITPPGEILFAGTAGNYPSHSGAGPPEILVGRLTADGGLDGSFGGAGYVRTDLGVRPTDRSSVSTHVGAAAIDDEGRVVVAAQSFRSRSLGPHEPPSGDVSQTFPVLVRYEPDGDLDPSLGGDGIAAYDSYAAPTDLALQPDGKLVVAEYEGIRRFTESGPPDATFASDGFRPIRGMSSVSSVALQSDGRIVAAGEIHNSDKGMFFDVAIARLRVDAGQADADADGFRDHRDECPEAFNRRTGCPRLGRKISMRYVPRAGVFYGAVHSETPACEERVRVEVRKVTAGRDQTIGRDRTLGDEFLIRARSPAGAYYAAVPRRVEQGEGLCEATRSRVVRVRGKTP